MLFLYGGEYVALVNNVIHQHLQWPYLFCLQRLALELHHQAVDSMKNTPLAVMISKPDPSSAQQEGQSYAQYLTTMRQQINYAKEIHDLLHESATKLMEKAQPQPPPPPPPPLPPPPQQPTQQPQQE